MILSEVVAALEEIAPLAFAEEWDNVGELVRIPAEGGAGSGVARVLLTIDLSEPVLDEAIALGCELVVAYHPPIFAKWGRLTPDDTKQRIVLRAIRAGISIYSPHTALDAAPGGVNDWLCEAFGPGEARGIPTPPPGATAPAIGRALTLAAPMTLDACVAGVKAHLGLDHVRLAAAPAHADGSRGIATIALCAGAGGGVLAGQEADLYLTGEMRHHDILAAVERGTSVLVCDHTNTERGYLTRLRDRLAAVCAGVEFAVSARDGEPLRVV